MAILETDDIEAIQEELADLQAEEKRLFQRGDQPGQKRVAVAQARLRERLRALRSGTTSPVAPAVTPVPRRGRRLDFEGATAGSTPAGTETTGRATETQLVARLAELRRDFRELSAISPTDMAEDLNRKADRLLYAAADIQSALANLTTGGGGGRRERLSADFLDLERRVDEARALIRTRITELGGAAEDVARAAAEAERRERERALAATEAERRERERLTADAERLRKERAARDRERERADLELAAARRRADEEAAAAARARGERELALRMEAEARERERVEAARLLGERLARENAERERREAEVRAERERIAKEEADRQRREAERFARQAEEARGLERERAERARVEAERAAALRRAGDEAAIMNAEKQLREWGVPLPASIPSLRVAVATPAEVAAYRAAIEQFVIDEAARREIAAKKDAESQAQEAERAAERKRAADIAAARKEALDAELAKKKKDELERAQRDARENPDDAEDIFFSEGEQEDEDEEIDAEAEDAIDEDEADDLDAIDADFGVDVVLPGDAQLYNLAGAAVDLPKFIADTFGKKNAFLEWEPQSAADPKIRLANTLRVNADRRAIYYIFQQLVSPLLMAWATDNGPDTGQSLESLHATYWLDTVVPLLTAIALSFRNAMVDEAEKRGNKAYQANQQLELAFNAFRELIAFTVIKGLTGHEAGEGPNAATLSEGNVQPPGPNPRSVFGDYDVYNNDPTIAATLPDTAAEKTRNKLLRYDRPLEGAAFKQYAPDAEDRAAGLHGITSTPLIKIIFALQPSEGYIQNFEQRGKRLFSIVSDAEGNITTGQVDFRSLDKDLPAAKETKKSAAQTTRIKTRSAQSNESVIARTFALPVFDALYLDAYAEAGGRPDEWAFQDVGEGLAPAFALNFDVLTSFFAGKPPIGTAVSQTIVDPSGNSLGRYAVVLGTGWQKNLLIREVIPTVGVDVYTETAEELAEEREAADVDLPSVKLFTSLLLPAVLTLLANTSQLYNAGTSSQAVAVRFDGLHRIVAALFFVPIKIGPSDDRAQSIFQRFGTRPKYFDDDRKPQYFRSAARAVGGGKRRDSKTVRKLLKSKAGASTVQSEQLPRYFREAKKKAQKVFSTVFRDRMSDAIINEKKEPRAINVYRNWLIDKAFAGALAEELDDPNEKKRTVFVPTDRAIKAFQRGPWSKQIRGKKPDIVETELLKVLVYHILSGEQDLAELAKDREPASLPTQLIEDGHVVHMLLRVVNFSSSKGGAIEIQATEDDDPVLMTVSAPRTAKNGVYYIVSGVADPTLAIAEAERSGPIVVPDVDLSDESVSGEDLTESESDIESEELSEPEPLELPPSRARVSDNKGQDRTETKTIDKSENKNNEFDDRLARTKRSQVRTAEERRRDDMDVIEEERRRRLGLPLEETDAERRRRLALDLSDEERWRIGLNLTEAERHRLGLDPSETEEERRSRLGLEETREEADRRRRRLYELDEDVRARNSEVKAKTKKSQAKADTEVYKRAASVGAELVGQSRARTTEQNEKDFAAWRAYLERTGVLKEIDDATAKGRHVHILAPLPSAVKEAGIDLATAPADLARAHVGVGLVPTRDNATKVSTPMTARDLHALMQRKDKTTIETLANGKQLHHMSLKKHGKRVSHKTPNADASLFFSDVVFRDPQPVYKSGEKAVQVHFINRVLHKSIVVPTPAPVATPAPVEPAAMKVPKKESKKPAAASTASSTDSWSTLKERVAKKLRTAKDGADYQQHVDALDAHLNKIGGADVVMRDLKIADVDKHFKDLHAAIASNQFIDVVRKSAAHEALSKTRGRFPKTE